MSDKDSQKTYRRRTVKCVWGALTGATSISIADAIAAWALGSAQPAWFISLTAAAVVAWFAVGVGVVVWCFQRIVGRATGALKKQLHAEVEKIARSLREELREDLDQAAQTRVADQWLDALGGAATVGNVRSLRRG